MSKLEMNVTPERIFGLMNAYQQSAVLKGAVELDVFTAVGEGANTVSALAKRVGASEKGTRVLADYLTVMELLKKNGDVYSLSPEAATFLDTRSRACLAGATRFLMSPILMNAFDVAGVVRKGGTLMPDQGTVSEEQPAWVDFARGMAPLMMPS